ncbi:MAG: methionine--tRNA ligase [Patescibacteria group bacterium]
MGKKFYITTAIDYANAKPHIGHALEKVQADALARFERARGSEVFFLTGTDEHGTKISRAAEEAQEEPQAFVDRVSKMFIALRDALNLSWDGFVRTTDREKHWPGVIKMWNALVAAGDIYKKSYQGLYCVGHEAFVTEKDLEGGICRDHKKIPEVIAEENYFFRLSRYKEKIKEAIEKEELRIIPDSRRNEILAFIEGLTDVSFSRPQKTLAWGIPVPNDEAQTMYVWADALTNYISAVGYGIESGERETFSRLWPADVQLIGKDILRFHAAIWPGMLMAAKLPLPKALFVHGFITVEGEKMSKTVGNVIDPVSLTERYGSDSVRYYLLREIPSSGDGDWSEQKFRVLYNADLANGIGNFASRVLTLAEREGKIPSGTISAEVGSIIASAKKVFEEKMDAFRINEAIAALWSVYAFGDGYVNEKKVWAMEGDTDRKAVLYELLSLLSETLDYLSCVLPHSAEVLRLSVKVDSDGSITVKKPPVLFPRLP